MATDTAARHDSALSYDVTAARTFVAELSPGARGDLLRVLTSSSEVRADVIRQFTERGSEEMVELLILLEEREAARQAMIEELSGGH
jgi:hypothetical protein